MYQLYITNQAKKDLKRFDKPIIKTVLSILDDIAKRRR
jgi:mRNA-degrading endonuclease RelE of RelBE toxin-antitoxin system